MITPDNIEDHLTDAAIDSRVEEEIIMEKINMIKDERIKNIVLELHQSSEEKVNEIFDDHDCGTQLGDGCETCYIFAEYEELIR